MIATHIDPDHGEQNTFDLPLSRADIADFLGLTIETVSRQLTRLKADGYIDLPSRRDIVIRDRDGLTALAG
jgi:CRP/FNR family transcriptional regulator